jgi:hypothetical protein
MLTTAVIAALQALALLVLLVAITILVQAFRSGALASQRLKVTAFSIRVIATLLTGGQRITLQKEQRHMALGLIRALV